MNVFKESDSLTFTMKALISSERKGRWMQGQHKKIRNPHKIDLLHIIYCVQMNIKIITFFNFFLNYFF